MKIKMNGMAPDGAIVRDDAEVIEGKDAREIVQAMMAATPMANGLPETAFIGDVLARIGTLGYQLPDDPGEACEAFLGILWQRGLAEPVVTGDPLPSDLTGEQGNAFFILGRVRALLRSRGLSRQEIDKFTAEATRGDYYRLLGTVMRYGAEE